MTKAELLRELYLIQHGGLRGSADHDERLKSYCQFLIAQGLTQRQVIDLLLLTTTYVLMNLPNASPDPLPTQIENLLLGLNQRAK
jgi:hypothetical protein